MARTITNLAATGAAPGGSQTSFVTVSVSTVNGDRYLVAVTIGGGNGTLDGTPTCVFSGSGLASMSYAGIRNTGGSMRQLLFSGVATASSSGTFTVTMGGTDTFGRYEYNIDQWHDSLGTAGAIQQSKTAQHGTGDTVLTCTFDAAMQGGSGGYATFSNQSTQVMTPRTNWSESVADHAVNGVEELQSQYIDGTDTAGSMTTSPAALLCGIAIEILAGGGGGEPATQRSAPARSVTVTGGRM